MGVETLFEPMDREREIPEENDPTTDALPKEDVVTVASPPTPVVFGAEASPRLEGARATEWRKRPSPCWTFGD